MLQLHVLARIVFPHRVHQAQNPGVNQILQLHLLRQPAVNPPRDILHLRKMLEQKPLALRGVQLFRQIYCRCRHV